MAEILKAQGYVTFCTGKWHLAPMEQCSAAGPFDQPVAILPRHLDVREQDVRRPQLENHQRVFGRRRGAHFGAGVLENHREQFPDSRGNFIARRFRTSQRFVRRSR